MIESELNVRFKFILNGTPEAEGAKEVSICTVVVCEMNTKYLTIESCSSQETR